MPSIKPLNLMMLSVLLPQLVFAQEVEFDPRLLYNPSGATIDTEQFRYGNPIVAGDYLADVYVNQAFRGKQMIRFIESKSDPMRGLCWSTELQALLDAKPESMKKPDGSTPCAAALDIAPDFTFKFDITQHRLDISIPQALLIEKPQGYIPPHLWQTGVPAGFVRYQFHHYHQDHPTSDNHRSFLGLQSGLNLGLWSLRHQGSLSWSDGNRQPYQAHETYLQRDLEQINGRIRLGDSSTQSTLLENARLQGIFVSSDSRMTPNAQSSYAPQITGHANSNALVRITQKDRIIYEKTVAPGPFIINDLHAFSSVSGDLTVEVIEENGAIQTQTVPFFHTLGLMRPKQFFYQAALGYYKDSQHRADQPLLHASGKYGINNYLTAEAGLIAHANYQLLSGGVVVGSPIGILSGSVNLTKTDGSDKPLVDKVRLGFSRYFPDTKTNLNADAWHFFSEKSTSLSSAVLEKSGREQANDLKNQYRISLTQNLGDKRGGLSLSGVANDYWHKPDSYSYQISYGNHFKNLQYQLGISKSSRPTDPTQDNDTLFYLNASLPFGGVDTTLPKRIHTTLDHSQQGDEHYSRLAISQSFGELNQYHYSASVSQQNNQDPAFFGSISASLPQTKVSASIAKSGDSTQYSYSASGAIVAHQHGITLNNDLGNTFGIVHAKGAAGTPIQNGGGSKIDRWGNGIVSNLTPYQRNHIGVDTRYLPDHLQIETTSREVIPRDNTAQLVELKTESGYLILFDIDHQGKTPPFGAAAKDANGELVGHVTPDGRLLVHSKTSSGKLELTWQQGQDAQSCTIKYQLDNKKGNLKDLQILPVQCQ